MFNRTPLATLALAALLCAGCSSTSYRDYDYDPYYNGMGYRSGFFYDELAPYGTWSQMAPYGHVWRPSSIDSDWRPYTTGQWAYTDYGWTWASNDPWGWATDHYGRWSYDNGWYWVPGDTWAPAWVSWRYGDGYVGWAPLPPEVAWSGQRGLAVSGSDLDRRIQPSAWSFVPDQDLQSTSIRTVVLPATRNRTLIQATRNVTRYGTFGDRPAERGLDPTFIQRATGQVVQRRTVADRPSSVSLRGDGANGTLEVYRPRIAPRRTDVRPSNAQDVEVARRHAEVDKDERHREEADRRDTEARLKRERQRLEDRQHEEMRHPPVGVTREELRERHRREQDDQKTVEAQERQRLEARQREMREAGDHERAR
ncbi:MAG TPA: DUF6600 domain-containing protein [Candidatus Eisenbacteria bacterium]|nr:DUF6600 domain-containing protein [Candidatus Eisenbacteria bacterium]